MPCVISNTPLLSFKLCCIAVFQAVLYVWLWGGCVCAGGVVPSRDDEAPRKRPFYGKKKPKDQQKGELELWLWGQASGFSLAAKCEPVL